MASKKKQVIMLYVSSLAGVAIGMLSSVINTNALIPEQYGDFRYIQNIISFISSLLLFGYFTSGSRLLALSKDEEYSRRIRGVMCTILGCAQLVLMLSMLVLYFVSDSNNENIAPLFLAALPVCGNVIMLNYINTTAQGDNHIGRISMARLLPTFIYVIAAYFIYQEFSATPMLMLVLHNGIAAAILLSIIISTKPKFKDLRGSFKILNEENKKYGFNVYIGSLTAVSTGYIAGITLGIFCKDNTEVGFYTLGLTLSGPLAMLPSIIGTTYYKKFANESRISKKVMQSSILITIISLFAFILLIDFVVDFLYNDSYSQVSNIAIWLAAAVSIHGFGDMLNRFLGAHGKGKELRNAAFICGGILIIGNILFVYLWGITGAVITKIASSAGYFFTLLYYYLSYTKTNK
ncbi:MAG: oligosaccharide flippase family protein [Bacteroidaceae bacterium]|nr:oligosaccharide flippase family protein [Bacteroidaceae bacterium]